MLWIWGVLAALVGVWIWSTGVDKHVVWLGGIGGIVFGLGIDLVLINRLGGFS